MVHSCSLNPLPAICKTCPTSLYQARILPSKSPFSALVSSITYGLVVSLYTSCFCTLEHSNTEIRRPFLFVYITILLSLRPWP
ncbi:hypothetical protein GALMADRAFT_744217 [Galerina marginata CBS 339.88]|uniref:Uncharacterized protein n=1 Tax=Galerina marginata (strain CBS 339.88) TaxID=685588 RepID=A0A067SPZ4_GALM3|nr:hypothetical protein GALMADRAFT_744217 [Galerina marginata CBS 339.88]